jgi:hypothetical protein
VPFVDTVDRSHAAPVGLVTVVSTESGGGADPWSPPGLSLPHHLTPGNGSCMASLFAIGILPDYAAGKQRGEMLDGVFIHLDGL